MTIRLAKLKARLLANPRVKAEYDALASEFEIGAELLRARQLALRRPGLVRNCARGAGTHNHRLRLLRESRRTASLNTSDTAYGSRPPVRNCALGRDDD
jgi:hypothetical protein